MNISDELREKEKQNFAVLKSFMDGTYIEPKEDSSWKERPEASFYRTFDSRRSRKDTKIEK